MSVSPIVTRGYLFSIPLIVTAGYGVGEAVEEVSVGGGGPVERFIFQRDAGLLIPLSRPASRPVTHEWVSIIRFTIASRTDSQFRLSAFSRMAGIQETIDEEDLIDLGLL
jgi:hypothetical protein